MPASFIDIMTLRPAARKSAIAVCSAGSVTSTTPPHLRWGLLQREAEIGHQLGELLQASQIVGLILLGEFDHQHGVGIAAHGGCDHRLEHRDVAPERDHGAVDQLDRDRLQLHQMLGRIHRLVEAAEMADAERPVADHRPQLQLDLRGEGERAFRADQQMRHVVGDVARGQRIEIVAADPALHLWEICRRSRRPRARRESSMSRNKQGRVRRIDVREIARHLAEMQQRAVGERGIHRQCVLSRMVP